MCDQINVSNLGKTWILDLDGTIVYHNGYKQFGEDQLLPGALEFLKQIKGQDKLIFITSRKEKYRMQTEQFLRKNGIRYDHLIFEAPYGERIVINDRKPSGLATAIAVNTVRDEICEFAFRVDEKL